MTDPSYFDLRYEAANYANTIGKFDEAFIAFSELTQFGHVGATVALANMYLRGEGVSQDVDKGIALLELATTMGHATAAFNLGALHRSGDCDVPRNPEKSKRFFLLARDLGCEISIEAFIR